MFANNNNIDNNNDDAFSRYEFLGRINPNDVNGEDIPPLYVYVKGEISNIAEGMEIPSTVRGFIFMSDNLRLFLNCISFTKLFNSRLYIISRMMKLH